MPGHRAGKHVQSAAFQIDDGSRRDADFRDDKWALRITGGNGRRAELLVEQTNLPKRRIVWFVRVKGIDAVVFRRDEYNVMRAFSRDFYRRNDQWLRVDCAVHFEGSKFAKLLGIDYLGREDFLCKSGTCTEIVVLRSDDLCVAFCCQKQRNDEQTKRR